MDYSVLTKGLIYHQRDGAKYRCTKSITRYHQCTGALLTCQAVLERISDGYTITAHGTRMEANGTIHWDYSTGGRWPRPKAKEQTYSIPVTWMMWGRVVVQATSLGAAKQSVLNGEALLPEGTYVDDSVEIDDAITFENWRD